MEEATDFLIIFIYIISLMVSPFLQAEITQTSGRDHTNFRPRSHKLQAEITQTSGRDHTNFRPRSHKLQAEISL